MWYYATCRLVAEKLGYEWGINSSPTHDYYNGQDQMYFMDVDFGKEAKVNGKNTRGLNTYVGITNEYYDSPKEHNYMGDGCVINMYDEGVFNIKDNTMVHLISQSEDYLIDRKENILNWFKIKEEYMFDYLNKLNSLNISLDENTCVINFRGGEYLCVANLIPTQKYWQDSIKKMLSINPNMKFIIITDDVHNAGRFIGNYPCYHFDVGMDFWVVNQALYSIISASTFSWWASWLNTKAKLIIAPKYWARHNVSNGYWSIGDSYTRNFSYMNKNGELQNFETCKKEALEFYKNNNLI